MSVGNVSFFFFFLCFALGNVDIIVGVPVIIMDQEVTLATGAHVTEEQDKMPGFPHQEASRRPKRMLLDFFARERTPSLFKTLFGVLGRVGGQGAGRNFCPMQLNIH